MAQEGSELMKTMITAIAVLSLAGCGPMPPLDPETRGALLNYYGTKAAINQSNRVPIYDPKDWQYRPFTTPRMTCDFDRFTGETTCY